MSLPTKKGFLRLPGSSQDLTSDTVVIVKKADGTYDLAESISVKDVGIPEDGPSLIDWSNKDKSGLGSTTYEVNGKTGGAYNAVSGYSASGTLDIPFKTGFSYICLSPQWGLNAPRFISVSDGDGIVSSSVVYKTSITYNQSGFYFRLHWTIRHCSGKYQNVSGIIQIFGTAEMQQIIDNPLVK